MSFRGALGRRFAGPDWISADAGTLFWKWALSPKNPREDYLEVAVPDPTFTDIVVPGAKAALDWAKKASPAKNCVKVNTLCLHIDDDQHAAALSSVLHICV